MREPGERQRCDICFQMEDVQRAEETAVLARLVGHAAYAICVRCGLQVPDREDPEYLARARRYQGMPES